MLKPDCSWEPKELTWLCSLEGRVMYSLCHDHHGKTSLSWVSVSSWGQKALSSECVTLAKVCTDAVGVSCVSLCSDQTEKKIEGKNVNECLLKFDYGFLASLLGHDWSCLFKNLMSNFKTLCTDCQHYKKRIVANLPKGQDLTESKNPSFKEC